MKRFVSFFSNPLPPQKERSNGGVYDDDFAAIIMLLLLSEWINENNETREQLITSLMKEYAYALLSYT